MKKLLLAVVLSLTGYTAFAACSANSSQLDTDEQNIKNAVTQYRADLANKASANVIASDRAAIRAAIKQYMSDRKDCL